MTFKIRRKFYYVLTIVIVKIQQVTIRMLTNRILLFICKQLIELVSNIYVLFVFILNKLFKLNFVGKTKLINKIDKVNKVRRSRRKTNNQEKPGHFIASEGIDRINFNQIIKFVSKHYIFLSTSLEMYGNREIPKKRIIMATIFRLCSLIIGIRYTMSALVNT